MSLQTSATQPLKPVASDALAAAAMRRDREQVREDQMRKSMRLMLSGLSARLNRASALPGARWYVTILLLACPRLLRVRTLGRVRHPMPAFASQQN